MKGISAIEQPAPFHSNAGERRRAIAAATIGNGLEWFDFTVYSFFAVTLAKLFFPAGKELTSILLTVATFGAGFVMRPVGAVVLGVYADRVGRKAALTLTILMMALGTAMIGLCPTYAQAGVAGPAIILIARLIQGFSAGGEIGGATSFLVEYSEPEKRGFVASWQQTSQAMAVVLGAVLGTVLTKGLDQEALEAWGWRVPFLLGLVIGPVGFFIRARIKETPQFSATLKSDRPLAEVLSRHASGIASGFGVTILWTVCTYVLLFYMPTYAVRELHLSLSDAFVASTVGGALLMAGCPLAGAMSDRLGRKRVLLVAAVAIGLFVYPFFMWLNRAPTLQTLMSVQALLGIMLAGFTGPAPALLAEQFPTALRSTGLSLAYNFAVTIFGGFASFIVTWLIAVTSNPLAPAIYVILAAVVSIGTLLAVRDKTGLPLA